MYPSIPEFFTRSALEHGRKTALRIPVTKGRRITYQRCTYQELLSLSTRAAVWLSSQGVREGDRVAILGRPSVSWAMAFFAIQKVGAVAVPLDAELQTPEAGRILMESETSILLCTPQRHEELRTLVDKVPSLRQVLALDSASGILSLWDVLPTVTDEPPDARPDAQALAVLMYTSGTTGDAKGVMLSHRNIVSNIEGLLQRMRFTPADRVVTIVPWYHIYGLTLTLLTPLWAGAQVTYTDDYRNLIDVVRRNSSTILVGVPKLYHALWRRLRDNIENQPIRRLLHRRAPRLLGRILKRRLLSPTFRFFASGGAPLAPEVSTALRRLGLGISEGYGLTETSPLITFCEPFSTKPGSVGRPLPGVEVRIDKPDTSGFGEVVVRGPNVTSGYYRNPKRTAEVLSEQGWLHTGDLGRLDQDGELFLAGRMKHVIVLETGKNVYPEEVEWELQQVPGIQEVLIHGTGPADRPSVAAMVYPNWEELRRQGITTPEAAQETLWHAIREAQKNLAAYKRLRSKEALTVMEKPFEKSTKQEIKRHLYTQKR